MHTYSTGSVKGLGLEDHLLGDGTPEVAMEILSVSG
jgi:hypothetical protein